MFENGKLDTRPARLPERLHIPTVADIVPGSVHWIDKGAIWFDNTGEVWINQAAPLVYYEDETYVTQYVRIIQFDEGTVIDWTSVIDDENNMRKVSTIDFSQHVNDENFDIGEYRQAVGFVCDTRELKQMKKLFKDRYGIKFSGKPIKSSAVKAKDKKTKRVKID